MYTETLQESGYELVREKEGEVILYDKDTMRREVWKTKEVPTWDYSILLPNWLFAEFGFTPN